MRKFEKEVSIRLLEYWIENHQKITYEDFGKMFDVDAEHIANYLETVSWVCIDVGLPPISAIVVNKYTKRSGNGYYKTYYPQIPEEEWWLIHDRDYDLIKRKNNEWPKFLEYFKTL